VWFVVFSVSRAARVASGRGYFNCPDCARRQPCTLYQVKLRQYLYGLIPLSGGTPIGPDSYNCLACNRQHFNDGSYGYDFGAHTETRSWKCFRCGQDVPYERFDCPHCGYNFEVGER
jgi:DNA-directed RNA polymerase subunit RPC12/RpoP